MRSSRASTRAIASAITAVAIGGVVFGVAARDTRVRLTVTPCSGPQGVSGATGSVGPPGPSGAPGPTGASGPRGPAGSSGRQGPVGPAGPTGSTGTPGATGEPGAAGTPGPVGSTGANGPTGPQGVPGSCSTVTGPPGSSGAPGAVGPSGAPGATGQQGPAGRDAPTFRGAFHSTFTDTLGAQFTGQAMRLDATDEANGVSISNDAGTSCLLAPYCGNITIATAGSYNIQFSAQLSKSTTGNYNVSADIWLAHKRDGEASWSDLPWTATRVAVPTDTDVAVAAWNFIVPAAASEQFRLMWGSSDTNWARLSVVSGTPSGYPAGREPPQIPGLIVTVQSVG